MKNEIFCLLSEKEKNTKFKTAINYKTDGCLTEEELRSILLCISLHRQYDILVYWDKEEFRRVLRTTNGIRGKTILGQAIVGNEKIPGELFDSSQAAAVMLYDTLERSSRNDICIFIPKERRQKGTE